MVDMQQKYMEHQRKGLNWKRIAASIGLVVVAAYVVSVQAAVLSVYLLIGDALYRKMYSGFQPVSYIATIAFWLPLIFVDLATGDDE